ncbi:hypothetical protein CTAYLR_002300 [Chrysophaeum taylorii]|uniref:PARP-type domain-containing protein n=1 Tax=Chrysophaeum taylorii TaxID=2483200 RepID=A0AAD7XRL0_9STRA|nr:hypothetical protein CTAYLR_002300 [Chrysophaeum taylorii]
MSSYTFSVEYAKSGRSTCKVSGEKIEKGEIRIAKNSEIDRDGESITMQTWHKVIPFFQMMKRMRKKENQLKTMDDLAGFDELEDEDQEKLEKMLSDFHDPDVDFPPEAPKKEKKKRKQAEDDEEEEPAKPKKNARPSLPEIEPEVREAKAAKDLRALAEELVGRCRARGLDLPNDEEVARQKMGSLVLAARSGSTVDVAAAIKAADEQFGVKKTVETECPENAGLALAFTEMSSIYFKQGDKMRGGAYKKVAATIAGEADPITSGKACKSLPGIGKASMEKIDEFLSTGKIAKLEELKAA